MKVHFKKLISAILAVALVVSMMVVPAGAEWNATVGYYGSVTMEQLEEKLLFENNHNIVHKLQMKFDMDMGAYRLYYIDTGEWYLNTEGTFPYVLAGGDEPEIPSASTAAPPSISKNKFIEVKNLNLDDIQLVVLPESGLAQSIQSINDDGFPCTMAKASINGIWYWVIMRSGGTSAAYYCNSAGQPYVAIYEPSATNNQYDYIINDNTDNSIVVEDSQIIDIENGILNLIDDSGTKLSLNIDNLTFDTGSKSYTVNAYNTYNVEEGDTYYTYYTYYTYNITYNITNTYVTYIGSNDAYEKEEYEYYYQLPDGRSSADLTADEIAGMSFEFHDVVNYARSATDVSVRALYHFDGNTDDSSYFSTQGKFEWTNGASITYMEAPAAFDGALYLDNTAHSFDITLPFSMGLADYTIQFRYYQASEPDTQDNIDNFIQIGGTKVLCWDEKTVSRDPNGTYATWSLPVGTWNEIALVRHDGKLYVYLNGLCVSGETYNVAWTKTISFILGSGSRAYSMIDELRVLDFAIAEGGVTYTPTVVPHDSNLVLVLPDSDRPMADEYFEITSSKTNLLGDHYNFFEGGNLDRISPISINSSYPWLNNFPSLQQGFGYRSDAFSVSAESDCIFLTHHTQPTYGFDDVNTINCFNTGLACTIGPENLGYGIGNNASYTFSIVHSDGTVDSLGFTTDSRFFSTDSGGYFTNSSIVAIYIGYSSFSWGRLYLWSLPSSYDGSTYYFKPCIAVVPNVGSTVDISYMELVEGDSDLTVERKTAVYEGDIIQPNTAAVQSEIPVKGYTVGGVRPTLPARGDLWFPVQEGRIQTCYIYTGSMWQEVGCRWYTGSRWIPIYAFDLTTLEDLFDIADSADVIVPIPNESGFWRWWQLQWLDFREWLEDALSKIGSSGSGSTSVSDDDIIVILPGESGSFDENGEEQDDGWSFLDLLKAVKDGAWKVTKGVVTTGAGGIVGIVSFIGDIGDFFDAYDSENSDGIWGVVNYGGADIWD